MAMNQNDRARQKMWVAIVGSRDFHDYEKFCRMMDFMKSKHSEEMKNVVGVVSGGTDGVDTLAGRWAKEQGLQLKVFPADWNKYGKAAGPIRNQQIVDFVDFMIAVPGINVDGSYSKGTASSINLAEKAKKVCYIVGISN